VEGWIEFLPPGVVPRPETGKVLIQTVSQAGEPTSVWLSDKGIGSTLWRLGT
jgi:hypothetical protein